MADGGSQQRKPDFRKVVEDVKALATVFIMEIESVLGRRLEWRSPAVLTTIGVVATFILALIVVIALLLTGGAKAVSDNAALIGALVALGGVFTAQIVSIALEDRRTHEARELEAQRAHEAALQKYFEQVGTLLIEQPLRRASPGDNLSTVVRAHTLAVLKGLRGDRDRKRVLMLFLSESNLLNKDNKYFDFDLRLADLSDADLGGLRDGILSWKNLSEAHLERANLSNTDLRCTDLSRAYLIGADLRGADLRGADLVKANLQGAYLQGARVTHEQLAVTASLQDATMPDGSKHP